MKILVLGASGFVGSRLVKALSERGDITVVAGLRRERSDFQASGVEQRLIEATDAASLRAGLQGVTHVINCVMGSNAAMVAATKLLCETMPVAGCKRLVHFSSTAVFGSVDGLINNDTPFGSDVDAYGQAKIECENLVRAAKGFETVILRPALIHGPGAEQWTARIGRLLRWRRLGDLGAAGDGLCNLVLIDDVVQAAILALHVEAANRKAFNLADPNPPSWNRYLMDFARETGAVPVHRLPGWQLKLETKLFAIVLKVAQLAAGKLKLSRLPIPDPITPSFARLFGQEIRFSPEGADQILGLKRTPYFDGLKQATRWFQVQARRL
ncbi:MAG: NAD-dependent epimerase/dehydratase family protein [Rhabdaerophilum sp.]